MIAAWGVVAVASFVLAALLAAVDGALLATGRAAPGSTITDPERAHRALAMARVVMHLVTGTALALALSAWSPRQTLTIPLATLALVAYVALVEGVARGSGYARGAQSARWVPSVFVVDLMMRPITMLGGLVESALSRVLPPADESTKQSSLHAERFREVVAAEAEVTAAEEELLHGVFSLSRTEVKEIMVPRVDVVGIDKTTPWSELLDRVRSSEHARFPVYDETLDNALGILYAKDLLPAVIADEPPDDWSTLIRPATFIPANKTLDQQLRDFKAQRTHIALVADEFGGTQGLVTIEDILEEVVGEIRDEFDEEEPAVVQKEGQRYWVDGRLSLTDLNEAIGSNYEREDVTTVGGLVYETLGRVPRAGDTMVTGGFRLVVEKVRKRRVERVYFERAEPWEHAP